LSKTMRNLICSCVFVFIQQQNIDVNDLLIWTTSRTNCPRRPQNTITRALSWQWNVRRLYYVINDDGGHKVFSGVCVARSLVFRVVLCRSLFVILSFFFWPLCCLSFDLRILLTSLVSSNSSCINVMFS
jgi:hypothetical protein